MTQTASRGRPRVAGFISPASTGSLGDQAMLDAATTEMRLRYGARAEVFPYCPRLRSPVRVRAAEGRLAKMLAAAGLVLGVDTLLYVGADVLDGVYDGTPAVQRLRMLQAAHRLGRRVRVLGSSWSQTPDARVTAFLRAAPWLEVLARDPISQERMQAAFGRPVRLVADVAFLLAPEATGPAAQEAVAWARARRAAGGTVLVANLSGHTVREMPGREIAPLVALVSGWLAADPARHVLLLPHDSRPGMRGDIKTTQDLGAALAGRFADRLFRPAGLFEAWEAKAVAGEADLVLTGRMHLAIAALGMGTPPLCLVYQGKFEGLMRHFGVEGLTFAPADLATLDHVAGQIEHATRNAAGLRQAIRARLPEVEALSRSNFDGL